MFVHKIFKFGVYSLGKKGALLPISNGPLLRQATPHPPGVGFAASGESEKCRGVNKKELKQILNTCLVMVKKLFYHCSSQKKGRGTPGRRLAAAIKKPGNAGVRFLGDCQCRAFRHFHALQRQKKRQPCGRVGKLRPRASGEERAHALNHAVVFVAVVRRCGVLVQWCVIVVRRNTFPV